MSAGLMAAVSACGLGAVLLLIALGLLVGRWFSRTPETGGVHRVEDELPPLPPAPVEVIRRFPMDEATATIAARYAAIKGRTEELPVVAEPDPPADEPVPVEHVEAAEEAPEPGAIGTVAEEESPEMADAAFRHEQDQRWTALLVGWHSRPDWLAEFSDASLQMPAYRRLVLDATQSDDTTAEELRAMVDAYRVEVTR